VENIPKLRSVKRWIVGPIVQVPAGSTFDMEIVLEGGDEGAIAMQLLIPPAGRAEKKERRHTSR